MILVDLRNGRTKLMLVVQFNDLLDHGIAHTQHAVDGLCADNDGHDQICLLTLGQKPDERHEAVLLGGQNRLLNGAGAGDVHDVIRAPAVGESKNFGTPVGSLVVVDQVRCSQCACGF